MFAIFKIKNIILKIVLKLIKIIKNGKKRNYNFKKFENNIIKF